MKQIAFHIILFLTICESNAQENITRVPGQNTILSNYTIKGSLTDLVFKIYTLHIEKIRNDENSYNLSMFYTKPGWISGGYFFGAGFGYRSYFSNTQTNSLFIEPFGKVTELNYTGGAPVFTTFSLGLTGGYKIFRLTGLIAEGYIGPSVNIGVRRSGSSLSNPVSDWMGPLNGIWVRAGINIGYAF